MWCDCLLFSMCLSKYIYIRMNNKIKHMAIMFWELDFEAAAAANAEWAHGIKLKPKKGHDKMNWSDADFDSKI